jgi:hypothetical protein
MFMWRRKEMSIEALKQALMQLNRDDVYLGHRSKTRADAITALRHAIAEAEDAVAAEREACAKLCDDIDTEYNGEDVLATWCAKAIRARGEK